MAPTPINLTFGTIAGFTVRATQRAATGADGVGGSTAIIVTLSNGSTSYEAGAYEDSNDGANRALAVGRALITGFAAIGAQTSLGTPGSNPVNSTPVGSPLVYSRSVLLTPGTPLPAGRGALVMGGTGPTTLKLAGGGTYPASDAGAGSGTRFDNLAVVDADTPAGAKVFILY